MVVETDKGNIQCEHVISCTANFARQTVTVALSGDGGDELFCGYNRYKVTDKYWRKLKIIPPFLRRIIGNSLSKLPPQKIDQMYSFYNLQIHVHPFF